MVLHIVVILLVLAVVWWIFSTYVLPKVVEPFKTLIIIVLAVGACLWLLSFAGIIPQSAFRW